MKPERPTINDHIHSPANTTAKPTWHRRKVLMALTATGIGSVTFHRALAAQAGQEPAITAEMVQQAEWIAGIELDEEQRKEVAAAVQRSQSGYDRLRRIPLENSVAPQMAFYATLPQDTPAAPPSDFAQPLEAVAGSRPEEADDLAFLPVTELAPLVRSRAVTSVELTKLYLERLHRFDPLLKCVVTFLDDLALKQAERADREIASGEYRGPLHGIPWGAKDLISYPGFPTTWGAPQFKDRVIDETATVARRLEDAGAVLLAKLSLGALAWGDDWFGGTTKNPWNPEQGSSGSSAGSAAATAAGLVGFSLGSETLGSIVSPCRRCGVTGLRPTFGRVSRHGCMTLAWSMDKIGPITRNVQDAALILSAIHGYDGLDASAVTRPFAWPSSRPLPDLRVGFFESRTPMAERRELKILQSLGVKLVPIQLPDSVPAGPLTIVLNTESAAAFDGLIRSGNLEGLNRWPGAWRQAMFVPATEYLRANRFRSQLSQQMAELFRDVDLYIGGDDLVITNLTGHPSIVLPYEMREKLPATIKFTGNLFGESELLAVAHAFERECGFSERPPLQEPAK